MKTTIEKVLVRFSDVGRDGVNWTALIEWTEKAILAEVRRAGCVLSRDLELSTDGDDGDLAVSGLIWAGPRRIGRFAISDPAAYAAMQQRCGEWDNYGAEMRRADEAAERAVLDGN